MLRSGRVPGLTPALILGVAVLAGCSDSATAPSSEGAVRFPTSVSKVVEGEEQCEDISFNGLAHGTAITNQLTVFGSALTFSGIRYDASGPAGAADLRVLDPFSPLGPDNDLRNTSVGSGECASCTTAMLVINDPVDGNATAPSDNANGGEILITGFPAGAYIKTFSLADHEDTEAPARLIVDGENIAPLVQPDGEHEVLTFNTTQERLITGAGARFILGNPPTLGSEAVDNIQVCRRIINGEEGCTPGYWKNHTDSWAGTGYSPAQTAGSVFAGASAFPSLASKTLLETLQGTGGPGTTGAASILLRAAVAALLNAAHPDVDYTMTTAQIIAAVNAALASNDRDTILELASDLDADNNLGCPIN